MNRNVMLKKIQGISNLPTLPVIAMQINQKLQDYESPVDSLLELLEKDQSLVLKILKLVNSSFFGFKGKVSALRHAVSLLGYNTIQNAVVSIAVIDTLAIKNKLKGFAIEQFWEHSIHVAVMCKYLALKTRLASTENAFTAGLLHDIGKVILANYFPDLFVQVVDVMGTEHLTFQEAEKSLDAVSHNQTGGVLAQRWMLPDPLVKAIFNHHSQSDHMPEPQLSALVGISDAVVHRMAGEDNYPLGMKQLSEDERNTMTSFLAGGIGWYQEVKTEMIDACSFFKQGESHAK